MVDRINEIRQRVEKALAVTPGPWEHEESDTYGNLVWFVDVVPDPETNGETPMQVQEFIADHIATSATAEFVAASIEDVPFLLARLAEAKGRIATALTEHTPFTQHEFPDARHKDHWSWQRCSPCGLSWPCPTVAALSASPEPKEGK